MPEFFILYLSGKKY